MPRHHGLVHYVALPRAGRGDSDTCMTVLGPFCWSFPRKKQKKRRFISIHIMHHYPFCRLESFQCTCSVNQFHSASFTQVPPQKSQQKFPLPFTKRGTYHIKKAYTVIHNKFQSSSNFQIRRERSCQLSSLRSPHPPPCSPLAACAAAPARRAAPRRRRPSARNARMAWAAPARDAGGRTPRRNRPCRRTATGTVAGMSPWGDLDVETPNLGKKVGVRPSDPQTWEIGKIY